MRYFFFLLMLLSVNAFSQSKAYEKMLNKYYDKDFPTISIEEVNKKIKNNGVILLDVRELKEYQVSHIKSSLRLSPDLSNIQEVIPEDKKRLIVVYCSIGARSQTAGKKLKELGYRNVKNMYGGFFHWVNEGFPIVDGQNKRTLKVHGYNREWSKWLDRGEIILK